MARQGRTEPTFDRVPPQDIEAERSVLGAMLLNPDAVGTVIEILHEDPEDMFYAQEHRAIYAAMVHLFAKDTPIDIVTVAHQLTGEGKLEEAGGASYLGGLTEAVPTSANAEYYAKLVLDDAILRRLIRICSDVSGRAYGKPPDVSQLLDRAEAEIFAIAEKRQVGQIHKIGSLITDAIKRIERVQKTHDGITGLATGIAELDNMLSGLQPSDMIVLAARPSVGKTALALNLAEYAALHLNKAALIFSLEMSKEQLTQRFLCLVSQIHGDSLRKGFLEGKWDRLTTASDKLSRAPIFIDDTPNISVLDLRSKARRHVSKHPVDLLIIDYLQLMSGSSKENRQTEIAEISRSIKGLARELSVPVVALSQLSREAEKDDSGEPKLSHLRESGAIEQDADVVLMLWRPPKDEENRNLIKLTVAKQRNGPTGTFDLLFDKSIQRFKNIASPGRSAEPSYVPAAPAAYEDNYVAVDFRRDAPPESEPVDDDDDVF